MVHIIRISFTIVNTTPLLKDLYQHVTPQYATKLESDRNTTGSYPVEHLDIIEHDNMRKVTHCCNAMLEKWLNMDSTASWGKIIYCH